MDTTRLDIPPSAAEFRVACCRVVLRNDSILPLSKMPGIALMKAAGWQFREFFCTQPGLACEDCILHPCCLYTRLYEPVRNTPGGERFPPPPLAWRAPSLDADDAADRMTCDLLLFGDAIQGLSAWIVALDRAGSLGVDSPFAGGRLTSYFTVESAAEIPPNGAPAERYDGRLHAMTSYVQGYPLADWCAAGRSSSTLTVHLRTPLQITHQKRKCNVPCIDALVTAALRRLECAADVKKSPAWKAFADAVWSEARQAKIENDRTEWTDLKIPHRSKAALKHTGHRAGESPLVKYDGLTGTFSLAPSAPISIGFCKPPPPSTSAAKPKPV